MRRLAPALIVVTLAACVASPAWGAPHVFSKRQEAALTALASMGKQGAAAAAFARSTAPPTASAPGASASTAGSTLGGVFNALSGYGGGGMGFPLPLLLIVALLGAIGVFVVRLRGRGTDEFSRPSES